jgi:hypothetical protein
LLVRSRQLLYHPGNFVRGSTMVFWRLGPRFQGAQRIRGHMDVIGAHRAKQKLPRGFTIAISGAQSPP